MDIAQVVASYGVLKENISALEAKVKKLREPIDEYLKAHPEADRTQFGEWELYCSRTESLVLDLKALEKEVGKRVLNRCRVKKIGQQVRVVRAKTIDADELVAITKSV